MKIHAIRLLLLATILWGSESRILKPGKGQKDEEDAEFFDAEADGESFETKSSKSSGKGQKSNKRVRTDSPMQFSNGTQNSESLNVFDTDEEAQNGRRITEISMEGFIRQRATCVSL